jgi:hypothetical protein
MSGRARRVRGCGGRLAADKLAARGQNAREPERLNPLEIDVLLIHAPSARTWREPAFVLEDRLASIRPLRPEQGREQITTAQLVSMRHRHLANGIGR